MKTTKKLSILLSVFGLFFTTLTVAQNDSGFGIKGGLNYGSNGDIKYAITNTSQDPVANIGYHIGVFGKLNLLSNIYIRPELVFTKLQSEYNITSGTSKDDFNVSKLDLPLLVGINVIGPVSIFAGPSFQYIIDTDIDDVSLSDVENDFTVGLNFGVAVSLGKLGLDLRYERGFSENEINVLQNNNINFGTIDTRPEQLILSIAYMF